MPSYKIIKKEKKNCYPDADQISVTEIGAEVYLQALLNHTATRILTSEKDVLDTLNRTSYKSLQLQGKWGFNGTTSQSEYKQSFHDPNAKDRDLFVTSHVPLKLTLKNDNNEDVVVWKNHRPESTRYCRLIRFQFKKETVYEDLYYTDKIKTLKPLTINIYDKEWTGQSLITYV